MRFRIFGRKANVFISDESGATLLEVLIVLLILGFIATLGSIQLMNYFSRARVDTARLQMNELSVALDLFRLDVGRYPKNDEGLRSLVSRPASLNAWRGPYLKRDTILSDPWNRPYLYQSKDDGGSFAVSTFGADGVAGGIDDKADLFVASSP